jgi:cytochrome c peroxidase
MKKLLSITALFSTLLLLFSCGKTETDFKYYYYEPQDQEIVEKYLNLLNGDAVPEKYTVTFPNHLSSSGLFPRPVDNDKAVLGRVLFYDKHLSEDGKISCASCHKQNVGFGDDAEVSKGVYDRSGDRNSLPLASVSNFSAYYGSDLNGSLAVPFFWDNRANTVAEQAEAAMSNEKEMAMHMNDVEIAVNNQPYYGPLFKKAFGDPRVSKDRVLEAIAHFVNAMGSYRSPFDEAANSYGGSLSVGTFSNSNGMSYGPVQLSRLNKQQNDGYNLYRANCAGCHSPNMGRPMLLFASNGLDAVTTDQGVGKIDHVSNHMGTFKVPTLRNIALTAPYMHDGRFKTLEQVIDHYSTGIRNHPNLHPYLSQNGQPKQMNFKDTEKAALLAFFQTLTDEHLLADTRFSDPFKQ